MISTVERGPTRGGMADADEAQKGKLKPGLGGWSTRPMMLEGEAVYLLEASRNGWTVDLASGSILDLQTPFLNRSVTVRSSRRKTRRGG